MFNGNMTLKTIAKKVLEYIDVDDSNKHLRPMITINFDDGYKSQYDIGFDLMKKYGLRGTYFVMGREDIDTDRFMSESQIKEIAHSGSEIGCHAVSHSKMSELTDEQIIDEWTTSKKRLEEITGKPVYTHAYPYGDNDDRMNNLAGGFYEATRGTKYNYIETPNDKIIGRSGTKYSLYGRSPLYNLPAVNCENITADNVKSIIDYFINLDEPCYLNFYMHQLFEDGDDNKPENRQDRSQLEDWLSYLAQRRDDGDLDVVPFIEGIRRLNGARSKYL